MQKTRKGGDDHSFDTKFDVVDADAHFSEALDDIAPYLDEPWRSRILDHPSGVGYAKKRLLPSSTGDREMGGRIMRNVAAYRNEKMSERTVKDIMNHLGLSEIVLISQDMLQFSRISSDDQRATVLANGYIDYMLDQIIDPNDGIFISIPIPWQDPEAAVELIDRVGDERSVVASCLVSNGPQPPLGDRKYDVIYEASQDHDLPVIVHSGGGDRDNFFIDGYKTFLETHTLGFLFNNQAQMTSMIVQGVPEKFPDLDIVFMESGLFWIPTMMFRLDNGYLKRRSEVPLLTKRPSEYMREFYYGTQPMEIPANQAYLEQVFDMIGGAEQLMYTSDYPHWDYDRPNVITGRSFLDEEEKQQILAENARRVFGL